MGNHGHAEHTDGDNARASGSKESEWGPTLGVGTTKLCIGNEDAYRRTGSSKCEDTARDLQVTARSSSSTIAYTPARIGTGRSESRAARIEAEARACGSNVGGTRRGGGGGGARSRRAKQSGGATYVLPPVLRWLHPLARHCIYVRSLPSVSVS